MTTRETVAIGAPQADVDHVWTDQVRIYRIDSGSGRGSIWEPLGQRAFTETVQKFGPGGL